MAVPAPGKLPKNTPISDLGLTPAQLAKLTPAARKLTKGDLVALQKWADSGGKGNPPDNLRIVDIQSLGKAVGNPVAAVTRARNMAEAANGGISGCCCCTPCCTCTAAAEIAPVRLS
jgi:hypothetical protein